ncbi:MAG: hypothetical protein AB7S41_08915 [Parvibaculaceae bacterium]
MTVHITINAESAADARAQMLELLNLPNAVGTVVGSTAAETMAEPVADKPKATRTRRAKDDKPATEGPTDSAETAAADAADEAAEQAAATKKELTHDDVRAALGEYVRRFGMAAAQEDGPKVITLMFGEGKTKVSDIPTDQASLQKAIDGIGEMLAKNPYKRQVEL